MILHGSISKPRWFGFFAAITSVGFFFYLILPSGTPIEKRYFVKPASTKNMFYAANLVDMSKGRKKEIWRWDNSLITEGLHEIEYYGLYHRLAMSFENEEPIILESLHGDEVWVHTFDQRVQLKLPDLSVTTTLGEHINDFRVFTRIVSLETSRFKGWAVVVNSKDQFVGCTLLLNKELKEVGRLYHPGWFTDLEVWGDYLFLAGSLNARERNRVGIYRPALISVLIDDVFAKRGQLIPFSKMTITEPCSYDYYYLKDLSQINPIHYIALQPMKVFWANIEMDGNQITLRTSKDVKTMVSLVFSLDLEFKKKFVVEHLFAGEIGVDGAIRNTRFQVWEHHQWGPWQTQRVY
jgi:hypothetical protein